MAGAFVLSEKEKKTELKKVVSYPRRLLGLDHLRMKWIVEFTRKSSCNDYISFCCPVVWFVYIYIYIFLHYTNDNVLRTNIADT